MSLYRFQWAALPLLLMIPLLAVFGVFGERWITADAQSGALELTVRYPSAFRYKLLDAIDITVRNRGTATIDTLTLALDTAYASRFSAVAAVPPFTGSFEVQIVDLAAGESRRARIEIQAERYWSHSGQLVAATRSDTARVLLTTMVYP
ncbi:MAG: hypothetical protein ACRELT_05225 [Longimicrobiales bacterium]